VLLQKPTENHADDPTRWWSLVDYLKAQRIAGRSPEGGSITASLGGSPQSPDL